MVASRVSRYEWPGSGYRPWSRQHLYSQVPTPEARALFAGTPHTVDAVDSPHHRVALMFGAIAHRYGWPCVEGARRSWPRGWPACAGWAAASKLAGD